MFAVMLCAAQPSGCEPYPSVPAPPLEDALAAPITMPSPEVTLIELPEAEAWRRVKSTLGSHVPVLQPRVLPQRFDRSVVMLEYAYLAGEDVRYRIGYRADEALINFAAGAVNSAAPASTSTIEVRGTPALYSTTASWPERQILWTESARRSGDDARSGGATIAYSIQTRGVSEHELLLIVRGLAEVP
ncbi:MAG TPA: hypothetical protein VJP45_01685 [Candidatus Limnocylindria bacterium]|nr:hypothetical protein [Candidatus Limnocylindria bacterium]